MGGSQRVTASADAEPTVAGVPLPDGATIAPGTSLGRYMVLELIGRGGMGQVLRAYDPKLEREVALKLVAAGSFDDESRERMLREARAMAKLSHPNVVSVFDAEDSAAGIMLVMELVAGQTLRRWVADGERSWRTIVAKFLDAGRGLAAAHAAELLHRDFKPANVLVSEAGEVKVTDFGLAKLSPRSESHGSELGLSSGEWSDGTLTRAGDVVGTPRYMAPEQFRGDELTPAADQYGFCVALWEALCGAPPFRGRDGPQAREAGPPAWPAASVPRWIADAVVRGLAPDPTQRWPTMADLLEALSYDPGRRRRRLGLAVGGVAIAIAAGVAVGTGIGRGPAPCADARSRLGEAWDGARRQAARDAVLGTGLPFAEAVWERTATGLDAYADRWAQVHTDACEATAIRSEQSQGAMDLRIACLHRARADLDAATRVLADADAEVIAQAHQLVAGLRDLDRCNDVEVLSADVPPPPDAEAERVAEVRGLISQISAERMAGRFDRAGALVQRADELLADVSYEPVRAELGVQAGYVHAGLDAYDAAETALRQSVGIAARLRQWDVLYQASAPLIVVVGYQQRRYEEGLRYRDYAEGLAAGDPLREAQVLNNVGAVLASMGRADQAEAAQRQALALRIEQLGPDDPSVAASLNNLGIALNHKGAHAEAEAIAEQALEAWTRALGPDHPSTTGARYNLALVYNAEGKLAAAETVLREVLQQRLSYLGEDSVQVANTRDLLGTVLASLGRVEQAVVEHETALRTLEAALGPEHAEVGEAITNLANARWLQGHYTEAAEAQRRAVDLFQRNLGAEHPSTGTARNNLAVILADLGDLPAAEAEHRRALQIRRAALGEEHPDVAQSLSNLANVLFEQGHTTEAAELAERAWQLRQRDDIPPHERAEGAFAYAKIREQLGEHTRAVELAEQAATDFQRAGSTWAEQLTEVRAWLAR